MNDPLQKMNPGKILQYLRDKRNTILDEMSVISYVTKPYIEGEGVDPRVVTLNDPKSHISEQYRSIRTNITSLSPENPVQAFIITSSLRGEGKTVTSANLAMAFSQEVEKKTILIDADLRKPNIHRLYNVRKDPGLSDILSGTMEVDRFLEKPAVDNLYIIPAGKSPANPSELVGSTRMKELIARLKEEFQWIIFDMAPILAVTDAGVLGSLVDGSIVVVKAGRTQAVDVERSYSLLLEANANPMASILTGVITYIPYYLYRYRYIYSHQYYST